MDTDLVLVLKRLAAAQERIAAAEEALTAGRVTEVAYQRELAERKSQERDEDRLALDGLRTEMTAIAPALRMLVAIAKAMRGIE